MKLLSFWIWQNAHYFPQLAENPKSRAFLRSHETPLRNCHFSPNFHSNIESSGQRKSNVLTSVGESDFRSSLARRSRKKKKQTSTETQNSTCFRNAVCWPFKSWKFSKRKWLSLNGVLCLGYHHWEKHDSARPLQDETHTCMDREISPNSLLSLWVKFSALALWNVCFLAWYCYRCPY